MTFDNIFLFRLNTGDLVIAETANPEDAVALSCGKVFETIQLLNPMMVHAIPRNDNKGVSLGLVPVFYTTDPVISFMNFSSVMSWAKSSSDLSSHYKTQVTGLSLPTNGGGILSPGDFKKRS